MLSKKKTSCYQKRKLHAIKKENFMLSKKGNFMLSKKETSCYQKRKLHAIKKGNFMLSKKSLLTFPNPLPNDKFLDWFKLKAIADDKINVT